MQELVELGGVDAAHRLLAADQTLFRHVHGDLQSGLRRALAGAGLQQEELAFLHGELDVLDVAEMRFEPGAGCRKLGKHIGHQPFERRLARARHAPRRLGQRLRRAHARHHVLALGIDQELAVKLVSAGGRITGEDDAGCASLPHIAEHHGLDGDRRAPIVGNVVEPPVGDGPGVLPGAEHGGDGAPQLGGEGLREGLAELGRDKGLEAGDDLRPVLGGEFRVVFQAFEIFIVLQNLLEQLVVEAEHHVGIHLDEAAIGVVGEAAVSRAPRQSLDGLIVEAEIEHGVHHAGHRGARARADRNQQRVFNLAESCAGNPANGIERVVHHRHQLVRELVA